MTPPEQFDPNSLTAVVIRIETKVDDMREDLKTMEASYGARIEALERFRWWLMGALGLGSTGGAILASKLFQ